MPLFLEILTHIFIEIPAHLFIETPTPSFINISTPLCLEITTPLFLKFQRLYFQRLRQQLQLLYPLRLQELVHQRTQRRQPQRGKPQSIQHTEKLQSLPQVFFCHSTPIESGMGYNLVHDWLNIYISLKDDLGRTCQV